MCAGVWGCVFPFTCVSCLLLSESFILALAFIDHIGGHKSLCVWLQVCLCVSVWLSASLGVSSCTQQSQVRGATERAVCAGVCLCVENLRQGNSIQCGQQAKGQDVPDCFAPFSHRNVRATQPRKTSGEQITAGARRCSWRWRWWVLHFSLYRPCSLLFNLSPPFYPSFLKGGGA